MRLSTRNQLAGTIAEVSVGAIIMASGQGEAGRWRPGRDGVHHQGGRRVTPRGTVRAEAEVTAGGEHLGPVGGRTVGSLA